jgi:pyruvate formate lyase activating enzyme
MSLRNMNRREFVDACAVGGAALGVAPLLGSGQMGQTLPVPAMQEIGNVASHRGLFWRAVQGKETECLLCPSRCVIQPGERGTCGVRENEDGAYISKVYARPCEIKLEHMEKGPFYHFLPRTWTIGLGFAGCNLDCKYCQSSAFAKARPETTDNKNLSPEGLVQQLKQYKYDAVTFTYSEPLQVIEYVLDVARLARPQGIRVAVHTAAYFLSEPFEALCNAVDAINIDLKGFSESFYRSTTGGSLEPVLNNIKRVRRHPNVWLELTNLVVPGYNDKDDSFASMCKWIVQNCGYATPLHVSKFFPQYKLRNVPPTPNDTLRRLRKIGYDNGLQYVYLGNMPGDPGECTFCPKCGAKMIYRNNYESTFVEFDGKRGVCTKCGMRIPGVWT